MTYTPNVADSITDGKGACEGIIGMRKNEHSRYSLVDIDPRTDRPRTYDSIQMSGRVYSFH